MQKSCLHYIGTVGWQLLAWICFLLQLAAVRTVQVQVQVHVTQIQLSLTPVVSLYSLRSESR